MRWARAAAFGSCVTMMIVLFELRAEDLHQRENLVGALGVEVAGRLVGDDQFRVGDDRPGDADALLLPAGELPRPVVHAVRQADQVQRRFHLLAALLLRQRQKQQRQLDVLVGGEHRQQVVELEDEADVPGAATGPVRSPTSPR